MVGANGLMNKDLTVALADVSSAAYAIGTTVLGELDAAESRTPAALSLKAAKAWGMALSILARQSQDARASVVLKKADRIKALAELDAVTKAAPEFAPAWAARAIVSVLDGNWDEADASLAQADTHAAEGAPTAAVARYYVFEQKAQQDDARAALAQAVEAYPGSLLVLGYLGDAYHSVGEYEKALGIFMQYLERVPRSPYAARRRDSVLARLKRTDEALNNARALYAQYPNSVTILAALASRQIDAGKMPEARVTLQQGLKANPDHPLLLTRLSFVELESGDEQKALALAEKAVELVGDGRGKPIAGYAHIDLARALAAVGRRKEAKASLIRAVRLGVNAGDLDRLANDPACPASSSSRSFSNRSTSSPPLDSGSRCPRPPSPPCAPTTSSFTVTTEPPWIRRTSRESTEYWTTCKPTCQGTCLWRPSPKSRIFRRITFIESFEH